MAQPTPYNPTNDFSDYQASNPSTPLPGDWVDIELAALELTLDETLANLALIQRDDGALANNSVGIDQLSADIDTGFISFDDWATSTDYVVRDGVYQGNKVYRCVESHTSGTFSVDLAAGKWGEILDFDQFLSAAAADAAAAASSAVDSANSASASATSESNAATSESNAATSESNAATSEANAAASASAAASAAAEGMYNNVIELTNADSPYVPLLADEGTLYKVDTTSGAVVINLSALSTYGEDMKYSFVRTAGSNNVIVNRGGSDTFNGTDTVITISDSYVPNLIVGDESAADWVKVIQQAAAQEETGVVKAFAGTAAPAGYLLCGGQAVSRTTYAALFAVCGTTFGAGDGSTTFNLPDLRGRAVYGKDNMGGTAANRLNLAWGVQGNVLGASGGSQLQILTTSELPAHTHTGTTASNGAHDHDLEVSSNTVWGSNNAGANAAGTTATTNSQTDTTGVQSNGAHTHTFTTDSAGSGTAFSIVPPAFILNWIIKT